MLKKRFVASCFLVFVAIAGCDVKTLNLSDKNQVIAFIEEQSVASEKGSIATKKVTESITQENSQLIVSWDSWRGYDILRLDSESLGKYKNLAEKNIKLYLQSAENIKQPKGGQLTFAFATLGSALHVFNRSCLKSTPLSVQQSVSDKYFLVMHQEINLENSFCIDFITLLSFNGLEFKQDSDKNRLRLEEQE